MSPITTHILDTTRGKPAANVSITLHQQRATDWIQITQGVTNTDGRITDWLDTDTVLPAGTYRLRFDTQAYFDQLATATFYPFVDIAFVIQSGEHYHVPLLLNPFGYSTYRGS